MVFDSLDHLFLSEPLHSSFCVIFVPVTKPHSSLFAGLSVHPFHEDISQRSVLRSLLYSYSTSSLENHVHLLSTDISSEDDAQVHFFPFKHRLAFYTAWEILLYWCFSRKLNIHIYTFKRHFKAFIKH